MLSTTAKGFSIEDLDMTSGRLQFVVWMQEDRNWHFGKNKFLLLIENIIETHILSFIPGHKSKYLQSYDRNKISNKEWKTKDIWA